MDDGVVVTPLPSPPKSAATADKWVKRAVEAETKLATIRSAALVISGPMGEYIIDVIDGRL